MDIPRAPQHPHIHWYHGSPYKDPYHWLRKRDNPEVIDYLVAENAYTDAVMEDTKLLQKTFLDEMRARIVEEDTSAPIAIDHYWYYLRTSNGKEYPVYCRKEGSMEASEQVLLNVNQLAQSAPHCELGVVSVSHDHALLAYSVDESGAERHTLYIKDIATGALLPDRIENTGDSFVWCSDNASFLYTELDQLARPAIVKRHVLGTDPKIDTVLFSEDDGRYFVHVRLSKSHAVIFIESLGHADSQVYVMRHDALEEEPQLIRAREAGHEYYPEHWVSGDGRDECLYIRTNDVAQNFRLVIASMTDPGGSWRELIAGRTDVMLDDIEVFERYLCVYEMVNGLTHIVVRDLVSHGEHRISFPEAVYALAASENPVFTSETLRLEYSSPITPKTIIDCAMRTGEQTIVKRYEIPGGYDASRYTTARVEVRADDGAMIPVSLMYRSDTPRDGSAPCVLYGYGAYGMVRPVGFDANRICLLDRGYVYAIAHVRGGGEKGRGWYEEGKFLHKKNTFTDFITVAEHLIRERYTSAKTLIAEGRSAGGMLMGYIANARPDLFRAILAGVPFVDVINTMMDPSIPLTVNEYDEWGNPNDKYYFEYMYSYSPYDHVTTHAYPHILVTAGLHDPRVQYWEPAKWVATLRAHKTDTNLLLLKMQMEHGHRGKTGRYALLDEIAFEYAFMAKALE